MEDDGIGGRCVLERLEDLTSERNFSSGEHVGLLAVFRTTESVDMLNYRARAYSVQ